MKSLKKKTLGLSRKKRAANREEGQELLENHGIPFVTNNFGVHLMVDFGCNGIVDFWPGTEKWISRKYQEKGFGIVSMIDKNLSKK
jgi:hypothetical protein